MRLRDSHPDVPSLTKDDPPEKALDVLSPRLASLPSEPSTSPKASAAAKSPDQPSPQTVSSSNDANTATGVSWIAVYTRLADDIRVRHDSPKTLKAYRQWVQHFQTFTRSKDPAALSAADYNVPQKLDHPISLDEGHWGERNDDDVAAAA